MDMGTKYDQPPFDPNNPNDVLADEARKAVLSSMIDVATAKTGADRFNEYILAGMMVGVVQVMQSCVEQSDRTDAAIRASILQTTGWSVDAARAFLEKPPLTDT